MKILSDAAITKDDLTEVDAKHTARGDNIRYVLVACTIFNVLFTLVVKFL